ncbi:MAG: asparagine synthetase B family protein [Longimicrobiales bacterium]
MSAILASFGAAEPLTQTQVTRMLARQAARGTEQVQVWREDNTVIAVSRYSWELAPAFSGAVLIAEDEELVVAADATVYYVRVLRDLLDARGISVRSEAPAHLIAAAYRAWGERCVDFIDGDFAFVIWDRVRRRAFAARDFSGKRPLHYAQLGRELVFASHISPIIEHPRCSQELNLPLVAATAAGLLFSGGPETCYAAVRVMPAAHGLIWQTGRTLGPRRYWEPPVGDEFASVLSHEDAAEALRELLCSATRERLVAKEVNTVWMSGGWDSSSVFAAAQEAVRSDGSSTQVRPVSISYPQGDPGREDEFISAIAEHWHMPVHWLDIADIPLLDREPERALQRDQPYVHLYEKWNHALAQGSRASGSRIALDGNGGDQLFQNSDVFLADLLRQGKWPTLAREWRARPRGGFRDFFGSAIQPNLGPRMLRLAATLRGGRRLQHYLERKMPGWMRPAFLAEHKLAERDFGALTRPIRASHSEREIDWFFTCPYIPRAFSFLGEFAITAGVELRSPLSDRRVLEFALSRPWWERSSGKETKRLLRRSMQGLLPDHVLAPRPHRTGITRGYSHRWMCEVFPTLLENTLREPMLLEQWGIVRSDLLREGCRQYPRTRDAWTAVNMFNTLQTELWLRARIETNESLPEFSAVPAGLVA